VQSVDQAHLKARFQTLLHRIEAAAARAGRSAEEVRIVAVSKTVPAAVLQASLQAGITLFGENYVQEFCGKFPHLDRRAEWHFIGHLQRNKVRMLAGKVSLIHAVDTVALAQEIGRRSSALGCAQPILLEVRLDEAPTKFGFPPEALENAAAEIATIKGVCLQGLMGMPAYQQNPEEVRPQFTLLRTLLGKLPPECRVHLSMGMSNDFEVAVEEGATLVRIGTALFGPRHGGKWTE
jgi:pyridoxal phosphate enzyme (YggS family)